MRVIRTALASAVGALGAIYMLGVNATFVARRYHNQSWIAR